MSTTKVNLYMTFNEMRSTLIVYNKMHTIVYVSVFISTNISIVLFLWMADLPFLSYLFAINSRAVAATNEHRYIHDRCRCVTQVRSMIRNLQMLLGTLLIWLVCFPIYARPIRVLTEHLPPYQIDHHNGVSGFATEVVRRTFEKAGIPYQIEVQDWSRAYQRTLRQQDTCIYSISKSIERTPLFQWVGELSYSLTAMYSLKNRADIQLQTLEDAKSFVTAVTKDDITYHYLLKHGFKEGEQLYILENVTSMLNVLQGRKDIDLVMINDTLLKYRALESGVPLESLQKKLELTDLPLDFHLACSLTTPKELVALLSASLQQIKDSGEFAQITAAWANKLN